jgi:uncharacterized protein
MGSTLCEHCTAACCGYIALPIEEPDTRRDFDDMRWYLMHEGVTVFVDDGDWYVQFRTRCRNLAADHRCGIYETRPKICREYKAENCDYAAGEYEYDQLFSEPEQIEAYCREHFKEERTKTSRKPKKKNRARNRAATKREQVG